MKLSKPGYSKVAFVDTKKRFGEKGQYTTIASRNKRIKHYIASARKAGHEIRYDYYDIEAGKGMLPYRVIITDVPAKHVQPFHAHQHLHEMTIVSEGEIYYIESDTLSEDTDSKALLKRHGKKLTIGDMIVDDTGARHTIANFSHKSARLITIQSEKKEIKALQADWIR